MSEAKKTDELKAAFRLADQTGDGRLNFDEFKNLLKKGNPDFPDSQAETLFCTADQDLSGAIDFEELVEYIFHNAGMENLFVMEASAAEEEAKEALLAKDGRLRSAGSKAAKTKGLVWRDMTWQDRLAEVLEVEREAKEHTEARTTKAPLKDSASRFDTHVVEKKKKFDIDEVKSRHQEHNKEDNENEAHDKVQAMGRKGTVAFEKLPINTIPGASPINSAKIMPKGKFAIADKTQLEIVDYSLTAEDFDFVGRNRTMLNELYEFRDYMKTCGGPLKDVNVVKFIAKGTAGWVFLVERKDTGKKVAMKLIRMTQARSGIRNGIYRR
jgi:hypothetical protein